MASSDGKLTLYAPSSAGNLGSLAKVQTVNYPGSGNLGHDLQPDYTNKQKMLMTATKGVYELLTDGGTFRSRKPAFQ